MIDATSGRWERLWCRQTALRGLRKRREGEGELNNKYSPICTQPHAACQILLVPRQGYAVSDPNRRARGVFTDGQCTTMLHVVSAAINSRGSIKRWQNLVI